MAVHARSAFLVHRNVGADCKGGNRRADREGARHRGEEAAHERLERLKNDDGHRDGNGEGGQPSVGLDNAYTRTQRSANLERRASHATSLLGPPVPRPFTTRKTHLVLGELDTVDEGEEEEEDQQ